MLTTHYMEEADRLCQRLAVIDHGKLLALDSPDALKRTVGGDMVIRIQAGDQPDRLAAHLGGLDEVTGTHVVGETVHVTARATTGLLPRVIAAAEAGGFPVHDVVGRRTHARDRLHQPHREGPAGMIRGETLPRIETPSPTPTVAFGALLLRDLAVLRKNIFEFVLRTVMQPLLFVFVFTYVFPKIGQGVGGAAGEQSSPAARAGRGGDRVHLPGHPGGGPAPGPGVQHQPRDRRPRDGAPAGLGRGGREAARRARIQGLIAALIVFPLAAIIPVNPVHLNVQWPKLLTLLPLACVTGSSLGLVIGTRVEPSARSLCCSASWSSR